MQNLDIYVDPDRQSDQDLLSDIQGNILKAHGRSHSANIFISITGNSIPARLWIANFSSTAVTSALQQHKNTQQHKLGVDSGLFASMALSQTGYRHLDIEEAKTPSDLRFRYGMKAVRNSRPGLDPDYILQDIPVNQWEQYFQSSVDLLIILADNDVGRLEEAVERVLQDTESFGIAHVERGYTLRRGTASVEHFGFVDGISQPVFFEKEIADEVQERGSTSWNPEARLKIVLTPDFQNAQSCGSYLVFRKLEQNVRGFSEAVTALAKVTFSSESRAAALVVGRDKDGNPLIPSKPLIPGAYANDFQFDRDVYGLVCPYHSHIRKANPRGDISRRYQRNVPDLNFTEFERNHRLARRGFSYGDRPDLLDSSTAPPSRDVGLNFMAYTSRIFSFEQIQTALDDEHFVRDQIGIDPLAGHQTKPIPQTWPTPNANIGPGKEDKNIPERLVEFTFGEYVTLKGGEYFFCPSISFLKSLASVD